AYDQIRGMNTDMLKAIVLYMALMVPFCFFVQKLLFGFTKLELDMLAFVLLFTATYVVFRLIHPAFRIAMNPEAIFIAFILGAVGCFVTWILHKRFETEMQLLFRNITGMESDVAYATVGQTAMMIGVNNMKRRRIRTSLTTATIVLVVFTMLAFSSVSKKMQPTLINKADESPYTGIFYHWPGGKLMDKATVTAFTNMFGGRGEMLVRRVLYPNQPMLLENVAESKASLDIEAVVGLPLEENGFLGRLPLIHGEYFSSAGAREIILPGRAFEALKIPADKVGAVTLRVLGEELKLVGVMDDDRYRFMRDLNPDLPLLPRKKSQGPTPQASDEPEDIGALTVDMSAVAFLPADLAAKLGAEPFTISIRFVDDEPLGLAEKKPEEAANTTLWDEVALLLDVTQAKFYVGSERPFTPDPEGKRVIRAGIYYIGSSYRTSIGGLSRLFIPLLIAGSIILNTMLGTVYERKYEIAVYNAIGLNPTHIFLFFLAEAFVYGVIGSVAGYLVGQVLAMLLKTFHLVEGVNINFSSLMVGYAILFTIGLVLLSTIYPGFVATRTAVPSGKRKWSLPDHDGQRMHVAFPFIYQPDLAVGAMYYLYDYFLTFTEQSIGDQIVSLEETAAGTDDQGRTTYRLRYSVALAPFDLGVTQSVSFTTHFDEVVDSYRVHMTINRVSGQDTNWVTTNRPFLEKLRKLLIGWRNIDPTQHNWYVEQGKKLFEGSLAVEDTTA
ncbi:MAG: ABC transporter permease, partial [Planctomycetota bacterium]